MVVVVRSLGIFYCDIQSYHGEIIESSGRPRHLSIVPLKNFHLFKIAKSVINFYLKKFITNNFK